MKNIIELFEIELKDKYAKKWNEHSTDFVHLYVNGKKVSNTLYRIGGFGVKLNEHYFMLLKYTEAFYSKDILKMSKTKAPKHLKGEWCIIDNNGTEKVNFKQYDSPYLQGGVIYYLDGKYYNIETGYLYCRTSSSMNSKNYLFLNDEYNNDETKCGVMQINKEDGTWILIQ
jgi:hypothetical protein